MGIFGPDSCYVSASRNGLIPNIIFGYLVKRQTLDIRYKREMANGRRNNNGSILNTDISFKMICFAMESSVIG